MTITWTLEAEETISGSIDGATKLCSNPGFTSVWFTTGATDKVYHWDGTTLTDLGFDTWAATNYDHEELVDITYFNGNLYAGFNAAEIGAEGNTAISRIARYSGGSWSHVADITVGTRVFYVASLGESRFTHLASDDNRIIAAAATATFFFSRLFESTNGTDWSVVEIASTQIEGFPYVLGKYKDTRRDVLAFEGRGSTPWTNWRVVGYDGGWDYLSASDIGNRTLQGYLDGKSFFAVQKSGTTWELAYSTDWGVNVTPFGSPTTVGPPSAGASDTSSQYRLFDIDDAAQLLKVPGSDNVYVWNTSTNQFDSEGALDGTNTPHGYFKLNNELFAIAERGANTVGFYSGGALGAAAGAFDLIHSLGGIPGGILVP